MSFLCLLFFLASLNAQVISTPVHIKEACTIAQVFNPAMNQCSISYEVGQQEEFGCYQDPDCYGITCKQTVLGEFYFKARYDYCTGIMHAEILSASVILAQIDAPLEGLTISLDPVSMEVVGVHNANGFVNFEIVVSVAGIEALTMENLRFGWGCEYVHTHCQVNFIYGGIAGGCLLLVISIACCIVCCCRSCRCCCGHPSRKGGRGATAMFLDPGQSQQPYVQLDETASPDFSTKKGFHGGI